VGIVENKVRTGGMKMKTLVISIAGLLAVIYLGAIPPATQRTPASGNSHASSKSESAKAGPKRPGERLAQNRKLSDKLSAILKQQNPRVTDLQTASQGFESLCQFVSAVHVSQNLGIPFDRLKSQKQTSGSLAKAIHVLKPDADVNTEVKEASVQAANDLEDSYLVMAYASSMSM
jgi:hypothetical protein